MSAVPRPLNSTKKGGKTYNSNGELIELFEGQWCVVKNGDQRGWRRYHDHYDRDGYCDNPGRGY